MSDECSAETVPVSALDPESLQGSLDCSAWNYSVALELSAVVTFFFSPVVFFVAL